MGASRRAEMNLLRAWLAGIGLCVLAGCTSHGNQPVIGSAHKYPPDNVPWPPQLTRHSSDYDLQLFGSEWTLKSDDVDSYGYRLVLNGGGQLPWAIYTIDGLALTNELTQVSVEFSERPNSPGDGTLLFVGLADYALDTWSWFDPAATPWVHSYSEPQHYRNDDGAAFVAVALAGPGSAAVETITFTAGGNLVEAPQNLVAHSPSVGRIELSWEGVDSAAGYNVYRSYWPDMTDSLRINFEEPVTETLFNDLSVGTGKYYFYQVTALGLTESLPSNIAAVWAHETDLAAPQSFRLTDRTADSLTFEWEWDGPYPDNGFYLYMDIVPNFPIIEAETDKRPVGRWATSVDASTYYGLPLDYGTFYYAKLCARDSLNRRGRMSAEAFGRIGGGWDWSEVETIDAGELPLKAVKTEAAVAVAYFDRFSINLAARAGGQWVIDTPLPDSGELLFTEWMDLAYSDGLYLIGAMDKAAGDVWAAYGTPGAWTRDHLHGDGNTDPIPLHIESGYYVICAASATDLAVLHLFDQPPPNQPTILLHTRPRAGGAWGESAVRVFDMSGIPYTLLLSHCLEYYDGNLYYLVNDGGEMETWFTSRSAGWNFSNTDIRGGDYVFRSGHDLTRFQNTWYTTAFDNQADRRGLYLLNGDQSAYPWSQSALTPVGESRGYNAAMDAEDGEAIVVYYAGGSYYCALYSMGWTAEEIAVPGVADFSSQVDILLQNGEAWFFFRDQDSGEIKAAHGIPPPD